MTFKYRTKDDDMRELHFKLPKALMYEDKYKKLSANAKLLYAMLNDRSNLSMKNDWYDKFDRSFIICSIEEIEIFLNCARGSANKYLKELVNFDLIKKAKASDMEIGQIKNNTMDVETLKDSNSNILYVGHVYTSNETLESHLEIHFENLKELKKKRKLERQEREQRAKEKEKLASFKNCTMLENTNVQSSISIESSNCNDSTKNELTLVQNLHGSNTDLSNTDKISMYVCSDESQLQNNKTFIHRFKEILEPSSYALKIIPLFENKIEYDLFDKVLVDTINNPKKTNKENYIISKLNKLVQRNIVTLEQYLEETFVYNYKKYMSKEDNVEFDEKEIRKMYEIDRNINNEILNSSDDYWEWSLN